MEKPNTQWGKSRDQAIKNRGHEKRVISCSDSFLLYVSDKTKKSGGIFVPYLGFCLSLRQIYFRYLRSNTHNVRLIVNTLQFFHHLNRNF